MTHRLLEEVAELPPADVMEGAREAVANQVLVIDGANRYAFRHALVGEAVHGDLLPGEDTALHARIAAAIDGEPELLGNDVDEAELAAELACHWRNSHELSRSLGASVRAGMASKRVYAYEVAQRQLERALELWERVPDADEQAGMDHATLLQHAAVCAAARNETTRAVALVRKALDEIDCDAEPTRAALLYQRLGNYLRQSGNGNESFAAFDRAVALLPPGATAERAQVLEERAKVEMLLGDFSQAQTTANLAIEEARKAGSGRTEVRALITLGFVRASLGDEEHGIETLREALRRASAAGAWLDRNRAAINLSEALDLAGHTEEALAVVRTELDDARERPERTSFDTFVEVQAAHLLMRLGRLAEACEAMPPRVPGEAVSYAGIFWRETRARAALLRGELDTVREELAELRRLSASVAEPQFIEPRTEMEVELALREDRLDDAREAIRRAAAGIEQSEEATRLLRLAWMAQRVEAEIAGRAQALGEPYEPALDAVSERLREQGGLRPRFDEACAWAGMATAELARRRTLLGDAPADPGQWVEVARAFDAITLPVPATYARYRAAEAFVTAGDRAAASEPLRGGRGHGRGDRRRAPERRRGGAGQARADRARRAARRRGRARRARRLPGRAARAHAARARGPAAGRRGAHEPGDRRDAVHEREDRVRARLADPRQARRRRPRRGGRGGAPAGPHGRGAVARAGSIALVRRWLGAAGDRFPPGGERHWGMPPGGNRITGHAWSWAADRRPLCGWLRAGRAP